MKKLRRKYNEKIDFKMLSHLFGNSICYHSKKLIFKQQLIKLNEEEIKFKNLCEAYELLKDNLLINNEKISEAYKIIQYDLDDLVLNRLEELDIRNKESFNSACEIFYRIIKNEPFGKYSKQMGVLLFNAILVVHQYHPIILSNKVLKNLYQNRKENLTLNELYLSMKQEYQKTSIYNKIKKVYQTKTIFSRLIKNQDVLYEDFLIDELYLFGSYAKQEQTIYSDIDIIVTSSQNQEIKIDRLKQYLYQMLKLKVDLIIKKSKKELLLPNEINETMILVLKKE